MSKKPVVLMVLDGYGLNDKTEGNAIAQAKTPVMDKLMKECASVASPVMISSITCVITSSLRFSPFTSVFIASLIILTLHFIQNIFIQRNF